MNELALFAGAGGGLLATKHLLKWRTVCYVEWNEYCVDVIKARIRDGYLDDAPIWDDVRTFDGQPWRGCVDIITAGFPCQPFSIAGQQQAEDDERNMWPSTIRVIRECQSTAVLLENVPGLVSSGYIFTILDDLAQAGYKAFPPVRLAAGDVGANHKRQRVWILAYSDRRGCEQEGKRRGMAKVQARWTDISMAAPKLCPDVADAKDADWWRANGAQNARGRDSQARRCSIPRNWAQYWRTEPRLGRVANGVAHRVDRLKAIGNGQVPAVVATVWRLLNV